MPKSFSIQVEFEQFERPEVLPDYWLELLKEAQEASQNAHAPYSEYLVGAALQLENGNIITGNNQENAAYPSGLCAERVAFFAASSQNPDSKIIRVAVVARKKTNHSFHTAAPCGACRQVMLEYEIKQELPIQVLMIYENDTILISPSVANLMPVSFNRSNLL